MALLLLGVIFLVGLASDVVGRTTFLPRVSVLLLGGLAIGPAGLGFLPREFADHWFPVLTQMALAMVGFLLGQQLRLPLLRERGRTVLVLSVAKVLCAALFVFAASLALGASLTVALVLAGIAPATAPAATYDVVHETGVHNAFTDTLLSIVAIDDAWGLIVFSLLVAFATGNGASAGVLLPGLVEVLGSMALGGLLGLPMAMITGRLSFGEREGEPILAEALGFVFICAGLAVWLALSPILAAMSMGVVVASTAHHHSKPFHAIEGVEWPFMILFFVLAGASLHLELLAGVGWLLLAYLLARGIGIVSGVWLGGTLAGTSARVKHTLGLALLPQAGVALGLALIASQRFPEHAQTILTVVLASTVILELTSPVLTRWVIRR